MIWRWHIKFNYVLISRGKCFSTLLFYVFMLKVPLLSKWTFHFERRSSGSSVNFQCWRAGWFLLENNQQWGDGCPGWPCMSDCLQFAESLPSFSLACSTDCSPNLLQWRLLSCSHGTGSLLSPSGNYPALCRNQVFRSQWASRLKVLWVQGKDIGK